ncbi:hypothetical protein [Oricola indica]|uniref:hypothetical protein n=1 Tax=Oricola indica TaxID=2872591 RepID=UPI003CCC3691
MNLNICILTDSAATANRTRRTEEIRAFLGSAGCEISVVAFGPGRLREFFRATNRSDVVIAQISPRRSVIAALMIWKAKVVFELRDPLCDWVYHTGRLRKLVDVALLFAASTRGSAFLARSGLHLNLIERRLLGRKLALAPEFGVNSALVELLEQDAEPDESCVYCGNIYDDYYIAALNLVSSRLAVSLEWAGQFMYQPGRELDAAVRPHGVLTKEKAIELQLNAGTLVLVNSSGPEFIPSKLTELLCLGRPIIYVAKSHDRTAKFIDKLKIGIVFIAREMPEIRNSAVDLKDTISYRNIARVSQLARRLFGHERYHERLAEIVRVAVSGTNDNRP